MKPTTMMTDVLSDVLQAVHLTGAVYFDFNVSAPWVAEAPPSCEIAQIVMPGAHRVIEYHLVAKGQAWGQAIGDPPVRLNEGDLLVFPQGDAHVLSSSPGMRGTPDLGIYARGSTPLPIMYELGGGGPERTRIVCCFLGCDERPYNPLLSALPRVIHLPATAPDSTARPLGAMLDIAVRELERGRPGTENVLARLSELMFVEALRHHLKELPDTQASWLAGLRDPVVGHALQALHREPRAAWTVESLGRAVGVSRSVLAARFTDLVGHPPMHYLALWRMQLASRLLHDGHTVVAAAEAAGYGSEAAFSRAFKKVMGQGPAAWRKRSTAAP